MQCVREKRAVRQYEGGEAERAWINHLSGPAFGISFERRKNAQKMRSDYLHVHVCMHVCRYAYDVCICASICACIQGCICTNTYWLHVCNALPSPLYPWRETAYRTRSEAGSSTDRTLLRRKPVRSYTRDFSHTRSLGVYSRCVLGQIRDDTPLIVARSALTHPSRG